MRTPDADLAPLSPIDLGTIRRPDLKLASSFSSTPRQLSSPGVTTNDAVRERFCSNSGTNSFQVSHDSLPNCSQPAFFKLDKIAAQYVDRGRDWKTPVIMVSMLSLGTVFSIGHHIHYSLLHQTFAGTKSKQQWSTAFGTGYAFLVVALLRTACAEAYQQYIWMIIQRDRVQLATLDKLFALTSDPVAFWSLLLLKKAKAAVTLALVCW